MLNGTGDDDGAERRTVQNLGQNVTRKHSMAFHEYIIIFFFFIFF